MQTSNYSNSHDGTVDISNMFSQGWGIFKQNIGGFAGFFILSSILISVSAFTVIGVFIVTMPLMAGFYLVADKIYKGEDYSFGNFFGGFKHIIGLFFLFLIQIGILWLTFYVINLFYTPAELGTDMQPSDRGFLLPLIMIAELFSNIFSMISYVLISFIPLTYIFGILSLAPLLVIFQDLSFFAALKTSISLVHAHLFKALIAYTFIGIVGASGAIAFSLGLILTIPLSYCMQYVLYRQLAPSQN